jgi:hypothetical protein
LGNGGSEAAIGLREDVGIGGIGEEKLESSLEKI